MKLIIPTIFANNKKQFQERFKKVTPLTRNIQIDIMDGKFVPSKSIQLSQIPDLKNYKNNFEAHLMTKNPERYFAPLKKKGFKKIIFHIETTNQPEKLIGKIKTLGLRPMIAINPNTSLNKIPKKVPVLFMGVNPGKEHQTFQKKVFKKIEEFREKNKRTAIQVDGGVNEKTAKKLAKFVDSINTGSFVSDSKNPKESLKKLKGAFRK